jgi:hypothetical protein
MCRVCSPSNPPTSTNLHQNGWENGQEFPVFHSLTEACEIRPYQSEFEEEAQGFNPHF